MRRYPSPITRKKQHVVPTAALNIVIPICVLQCLLRPKRVILPACHLSPPPKIFASPIFCACRRLKLCGHSLAEEPFCGQCHQPTAPTAELFITQLEITEMQCLWSPKCLHMRLCHRGKPWPVGNMQDMKDRYQHASETSTRSQSPGFMSLFIPSLRPPHFVFQRQEAWSGGISNHGRHPSRVAHLFCCSVSRKQALIVSPVGHHRSPFLHSALYSRGLLGRKARRGQSIMDSQGSPLANRRRVDQDDIDLAAGVPTTDDGNEPTTSILSKKKKSVRFLIPATERPPPPNQTHDSSTTEGKKTLRFLLDNGAPRRPSNWRSVSRFL
ncbi:uncharacterized protein B0T23DRAFT_372055 [Neurospora hispaniola]|uniref:Uncharacterized protein n=1 Tax=Neurospora hispaniola TaxID=588809 RepID=A0AAJ0IHH1_9PEZI|nr:hypothetical protein B0T23DRAFT_372055 [Neurospora hispaniola]